MDDLFNFSLPDFSLPDFGGDFLSDVPNLTEDVAKFALSRAFGGRGSDLPQQIFNRFSRQAFGSSNTGSSQTGAYFQASSGQSMAQLASMIQRAGRRFL